MYTQTLFELYAERDFVTHAIARAKRNRETWELKILMDLLARINSKIERQVWNA